MVDLIGRAAQALGDVMVAMRKGATPHKQAIGDSPAIPDAKPQRIMTLKMPTAVGWADGQKPTPATGLAVNAFAEGLDHPRWVEVLPNGDVLVAESREAVAAPESLYDHAKNATMKRAKAIGPSANRISLWRDPDGDGIAEERHVFRDGLNQPIGMALVNGTFYIGNTDGIVALDYQDNATQLVGEPRKLVSFKPRGHWTRSLIASPDGKRIYAGVGSLTNIGDEGMEAEKGRASIWELDVETGQAREFATGLRNAVGMAWEPDTGALWTVVNERDGLGDETPPDYLTSVKEGGFYGWPWCYWDRIVDDRVPANPKAVASALTPDYALGGHTASLGLCWMPEGTLPGFGAGMVIGQHGSWNRAKLSGYRVIFVPFSNGKPSGPPRDILSGFLSPNEREAWGRPVGVAVGPDRRSILVVDDVGDVVWRVTGA